MRTLIRQDFAAALSQVDAIVSPTAPTAAFKLGEKLDDPLAMYLNDVFTLPCNLAGLPGMSLPCGFSTRPACPSGYRFSASPSTRPRCSAVGRSFERAHDFVRSPPLGEA